MNARLLTVPLFAIAAVAFVESAQIRAKAMIAQRLIERAWERSLEGEGDMRPWHWADTWPIARLQSPGLTRDLFVLAGANGGSLAFGPGHFSHTALPGEPGASVIAGHRDTHFQFMQSLKPGDEIRLQSRTGKWHMYRVRELLVVDTSKSAVWSTPTDRDELHLITCYPFDANAPGGPLRFVAIAEWSGG